MSHHVLPRPTHEQLMEAGLTLVPDFDPGKLWEIQVTASALEKAAIRLRAIPNYPDCQDRRASYRAIVQECIADMKKVLSDA